MFVKNVDTTDRKAMIDFLINHFRYYTMNSWNRSTSYANNVKLQNLNIPSEKLDIAYGLIARDIICLDYDDEQQALLQEFEDDTGYGVGFNGRSSGYLVMYETTPNEPHRVMPGRPIDQYERFDDWDDDAIRERVELVMRFDELCDDLRDLLLRTITDYTLETHTVTTVVTNVVTELCKH